MSLQEFMKTLTGREKEIMNYIIEQIKINGEFIYKVRELKEKLQVHNLTLKRLLEKAHNSAFFVVEDLGIRNGYKILFKSEDISLEALVDSQTTQQEVSEHKLENQEDQKPMLIGREKEIKIIVDEINKRRNILLFGEMGTGKTAILKYIYDTLKAEKQKIIYADYAKSFKQFLVNVIYQIHCDYKEVMLHEMLDKGKDDFIDWPNMKKRVGRMTTNDLAGLIIRQIKGQDYIIICDHLERITPNAKAVIETLREHCCLVGATWFLNSNVHLKKLWWRFKNIEIKNLEKQDAEKLIDYFLEQKNLHIYNKSDFIQKLLKVSKGNCASIYDMIYHAEKEKYVDRQHIREIEHEAGRKEFDLTLAVVFIGVVVMAVRFFALGMNNKDVYILAGVSGAVFMFVRFVLTRGMR